MQRVTSVASVAAVLVLVSSCSSSTQNGACAYTYECEAGFICQARVCIAVTVDSGVTPDAGGPPGDAGLDAGSADAGSRDGGASEPDAGTRLTFAPGSYRHCHDDLECAVFGGNCLTELTLSRPTASGVDRVKVSAIDPSFAAGEGVCTLPCTSDPRICESFTVTSPTGAAASFSCQVVYAAASPYPSAPPAFPFDAQLDLTAMARGVPFASVCRPPFQFSVTHPDSFCQPCTQDLECGSSSACYLEHAASTPRSGSCVESCSASAPCAFGFTCGALPGSSGGATYCLPSAGTCGRCRDSDSDLRGVGRCGALTEPNTAVDCDDANPIAYYDSSDPGHAFPAVCGPSDVNCNGKSDDTEQLGSEAHCGACGDVCVGRVGDIANGRRACLPRGAGFSCTAACDTGYADCDGDVSNGCEALLGANSIYAEDQDGDGRGSQSNFRYVCTGAAPAGWVQNRLDCNDANPAIYGGSATLAAGPELCDGLDNNCNGVIDDVGFIVGEGTTCDTGVPGLCAAGTRHCTTLIADAGASASFSCVGLRNPVTQATVAESCNGLDDNCNGQVDEDLDYFEANGQTNPRGRGAPAPCANPGGKGICAQGAYACTVASTPLIDGGTLTSGAWTCQANLPQSTDPIDDLGTDSNCDGSDGDLSNAIFVRPIAGGGSLDGKDTNPGSSQQPVATLQRALTLACAGGAPCKDIYLEAKTFSATSAVLLPTFVSTIATTPPPVRIYGGFTATVNCGAACQLIWTRGSDPTVLVRESGPKGGGSYPFGTAYAAMQAAPGTGVLSVLLDQLSLQTHAPDATAFLQNGESAPTQLGFVCPGRGCGALVFRNASFAVDPAINGGDGATTATPVGSVTGGDGCGTSSNCSGVTFANGNWMQYQASDDSGAVSIALGDATVGKAAAGCPDGAQNNGGYSAAFRYQPPSGNRLYFFVGGYGYGGGSPGECYEINSDGIQHRAYATRGGNGSGGSGASRFGTYDFRLQSSAELWLPSTGLAFSTSGYGTSGRGGGGGCGCINNSSYFTCIEGEERGGGGGAGGCGGFAGGNGGHGGNAIGLVLAAGPTIDTTLTTSGAFQVTVGNAGKAGNGGKGGAGAAGGYGGLSPSKNAFFSGGHGGDGGGGGGGAGGVGGSSIGIFRQCLRPGGTVGNGCGLNLPPVLLAAPGSSVSIGSAGAAGGAGAAGPFTPKTTDFNGRTDTSTPAPGTPGAAGVAGLATTLYFNN